ncbi:hypothetical protein LR48_Vigan503s000300 [Vigna angularis]|uniref:Uncharacterized protein n=1 Tax=Phaseolus angularis TaxID=3914 RepID=A0A0L9TC49_PHAAN|nr:hypothetical protein LR48_Vigan503s000300 [Vigna angularis]
MGEEREECDGGDEHEEVKMGAEEEDCDGGDEHDYLREEEEGGNVNDRVDQVRRNINPVLDRWNTMKKEKKHVTRRGNVGEGSFIMNEEVGDHDINEEYNSDELDSNVDSDEDNTRGTSSVGGSGSTRATSTAGGSQAQQAPSTSQVSRSLSFRCMFDSSMCPFHSKPARSRSFSVPRAPCLLHRHHSPPSYQCPGVTKNILTTTGCTTSRVPS